MSFGGNHGLLKYPMPAGYSPLTDALVTKLVSAYVAHITLDYCTVLLTRIGSGSSLVSILVILSRCYCMVLRN